MSTLTSRLSIPKPGATDPFLPHTDIGNVADALDNAAMYEQGAIGSIPAGTTRPNGYWYADTATGARVWVNVGTGGSRAYRSLATGAEFDTHTGSTSAHGNARGGLGGITDETLRAGVISGGDLTRLSSSQVQVAAGSAWLRGSPWLIYVTWPQTTLTIAASSTNPRLDSIQVTVPGGSGHGVVGTVASSNSVPEGAGVTIASDDSIVLPQGTLADVLVGTGGVPATGWYRDRRAWAAGAAATVAVPTGTNYSAGPLTNLTAIDTTNLARRVECQGAGWEIDVRLTGTWTNNTISGRMAFGVLVDGVNPYGTLTAYPWADFMPTSGSGDQGVSATFTFAPSSGTHVIALAWAPNNTGTLFRDAGHPLTWTLRERVAPGPRVNQGA